MKQAVTATALPLAAPTKTREQAVPRGSGRTIS